MDFSKFADENFDCKEWVNAALRAKKDSQTPLDVSELGVLRLNMANSGSANAACKWL